MSGKVAICHKTTHRRALLVVEADPFFTPCHGGSWNDLVFT